MNYRTYTIQPIQDTYFRPYQVSPAPSTSRTIEQRYDQIDQGKRGKYIPEKSGEAYG